MSRHPVRDGWPTKYFGVDPCDGRTVSAYAQFLYKGGSSLNDLIESLGGPSSEWLPFGEARIWARSLGLTRTREWYTFTKENERPDGIPVAPDRIYAKCGWLDWGDWLGTGRTREWRSFAAARKLARSLGLNNSAEWRAWVKSGAKPADIPSVPHTVYAGRGWVNWADWLDTKNVHHSNIIWLPFAEARAVVRALRLENWTAWCVWASSGSRPVNIPSNPGAVYNRLGWVDSDDWLGTGRLRLGVAHQARQFNKARAFARSLGLRTQQEWRVWAKNGRPPDVPSNPASTYKNAGWVCWADWLGSGRVPFLPFVAARRVARALGLTSERVWHAWANSPARPNNIPAYPRTVYQEFCGMSDWLGTNRRAQVRRPLPFNKARAYARSLEFRNQKEWQKWATSGSRPNNIPSNPYKTYAEKGWVDWGDWLGTGNVHGSVRRDLRKVAA
jgi:hypothetical protein